ncbi:LTA synthase family protein [Nocardioides jishulii]|uniref:LTA synthase family protein n=1 Tax=Nocardioides jishulii TaxID=2575440 RepID=A0A4U2YM33_9ACTN|nr:LTA synthase family protein [Nocardioides jishulii]QCX27128.1 LTA synthase family protein [Nocardioides jishulii]TKI61612.1 LTA synthase family protein [Nocardioides jishulii]
MSATSIPADGTVATKDDAGPTVTATGAAQRGVGNRIAWALVVTAASAVLCDLALAMSLRLGGQAPLKPGPALVGMALLWVLLLGLVGLTGRVRRGLQVGFLVVAFLAAVNAARMDVLQSPLVPSDVAYLRAPAFLIDMVGVPALLLGVCALGALLLLLLWLGRVAGRSRPAPPRRGQRGWEAWILFRAVGVGTAITLAWLSAGFNTPGNPVRAIYDAAGAQWLAWSPTTNYQGNGFVGGTLFSLPAEPMEQPPSYSADRMAEISKKWVRLAAERNRGADADVLARTNVVVVLSESMGDPSALERTRLAEDALPGVRRLMAQGGGHMFAAHYGTGTSLMEFGVLTGQSPGLFGPHIVSPYQQFVADQEDYPSAVGWLGTVGHRVVALHPFRPELYARTEVYDRLGFDEFVDEAHMANASAVVPGGFVSDASAYAEVVQQLEESDSPALVHLVSMQNHVPFSGLYDDPVEVESAACCEEEIGQWARGLAISDAAVQGFLASLEELDEPTVVLHFGDHFPGIFDASDTRAEGLNLHRTPWFVWSNVEGAVGGAPELLSPTAALPMVLERIGAPLPPYLLLVKALQDEVGTVRGDTVVTPEGDEVALASLDEAQRELLEEARLVQYDFSVGQRHALEALWYSADN